MIVLMQLEFNSEEDYQAFWTRDIQRNEFVVDAEELGKYKGVTDQYEDDDE